MREPRDPLLQVVFIKSYIRDFEVCDYGGLPRDGAQVCGKRRAAKKAHSRNSIMILPQVHLRKPCYDFYFL